MWNCLGSERAINRNLNAVSSQDFLKEKLHGDLWLVLGHSVTFALRPQESSLINRASESSSLREPWKDADDSLWRAISSSLDDAGQVDGRRRRPTWFFRRGTRCAVFEGALTRHLTTCCRVSCSVCASVFVSLYRRYFFFSSRIREEEKRWRGRHPAGASDWTGPALPMVAPFAKARRLVLWPDVLPFPRRHRIRVLG